MVDGSSSQQPDEPKGSWIPFCVIVTLWIIYKIAYGTGRTPMRIRRFYNVQVRFAFFILCRNELFRPISSWRD